jgi:hypothetical protein
VGEKKVKLPKTAEGWAIHLSKLVKVLQDVHGLERFPIRVADIAREYSSNVFPDAPISLVEGRSLGSKFEGALIPRPDSSGEWGIFYNSDIRSPGRINFTLGHELGHYLLHRQLSGDPNCCAKSDMWVWDSEYGKMEAEANQFASYLLMPLDDFRQQTSGLSRPCVEDFDPIRRRYDVSLTAAILKWLSITDQRAMIVKSLDGFIDWSWSSKPLLRSGVFFRAKQKVIPVPEGALARREFDPLVSTKGETIKAGIWADFEEVFESVVHSDHYDMVISLLIYPKSPPDSWRDALDDEIVEDAFDRFTRGRV